MGTGSFWANVRPLWFLPGECRLERHRFRFMSAVQGRKHALADLGPLSAAETVEDLSGECEGRCVVDGSF